MVFGYDVTWLVLVPALDPKDQFLNHVAWLNKCNHMANMGNAWLSNSNSLNLEKTSGRSEAQAGATGGVSIAMFNLLYGGEFRRGCCWVGFELMKSLVV